MRRSPALLLLAGVALPAASALSTDYRIEADRSHADFAVRLLWLHAIDGRFTRIDGQVRVDPRGLATVDAHIGIDSLAMASTRFRNWALGTEFFDAARYPRIHFVSEPVALATLNNGGALDGLLNLHGVTLPVHFELRPTDCRTISTGCVIQVHGTLSRGAFGMDSHRAALSDQVQLGLSITLGTPPASTSNGEPVRDLRMSRAGSR
ncbi:YceI family protein [Rhodanobacter sp. Col0626]|uniref:YceI family protein n=1 Tax=Rhodanobacter sp. Col0626 TaxID=3415679 RepID=UPI003CF48B63